MTIDQNEPIDPERYQLIDFGNGRKLESVAGHMIDRPCPAADLVPPQSSELWMLAESRYDAGSKAWTHRQPWPAGLNVDCGAFRMPIVPTPFGHIGLFPEQADNWDWLAKCSKSDNQQRQALNLFGYTGASTMALIASGFSVAHVDAAKPNVQSARQAAVLNGWESAPIRYLIDDAAKFVARERRRKRIYHTIVLDPPAYGHSPQGTAWRIERDLWPLLDDCLRLMNPDDFRLLITGHSPQVNQADVCSYLKESEFFARADSGSGLLLTSGRSQLQDRHRRVLDAGYYVRASTPT